MKININGRDAVALCVLVACTWLLSCGIDTVVGYSLLAVVVGYFGYEIVPPQIRKLTNGRKK